MDCIIKRNRPDDVLCHYGVLGMKWGVRRYRNKDGSLTSAGKKRRLTVEERKANGRELNEAFRKAAYNGRWSSISAAEKVWNNSATMKKFAEITQDDYKKRNAIYDGTIDIPKSLRKEYDEYAKTYGGDNVEARVYWYGDKFEKILREKASKIVYDKKDINGIIDLVCDADVSNEPIIDNHSEWAWLYWH